MAQRIETDRRDDEPSSPPPSATDAWPIRALSPAANRSLVLASAGGLEAFVSLLSAVPADTGMAFVVVSHLDPTHASALPEILARATAMTITEAGRL